ncbi:MAG: hypothetical protein WCQ95_12575 [Bacteroidota bacterium]
MKKFSIILISVFITLAGYSQTSNSQNTRIIAHYQIHQADTSTTFTINYQDYEKLRKIFMLTWDRPDVISAGYLIWNNLSIQDVGNNLKITLSDGIITKEGDNQTYRIFADDITKKELLNKMSDNQFRQASIELRNQNDSNIINSNNLAKKVIMTLEKIIDTFN